MVFKMTGLAVGGVAVAIALTYAFDELTFLEVNRVSLGDIVVVLASLALAFSGFALMAQLPESLRAKFRRPPMILGRRPVYGFGTMLAIGVGATLGSPLFILIPENIVQYEYVSLASLVIATILSVGMAKVYSDMYKESQDLGLEGVGGPSFTKLACGARSVRYFVSRLSMWIANTALAAYSKIVFLVFDFVFLPSILRSYGLSDLLAEAIVYLVAGTFVLWTLINVLFEQRYLRLLGALQIILTAALLVILVYHSILLGNTGNWDLSGFFNFTGGGAWPAALLINTGYLYLLFFGFQEIQSLERDAVTRSRVPILSWVRKGYTWDKTTYFGVAMILSVVIASAVNILYGIAVYASHPSLNTLVGAQIPALYLAQNLLGPGQEILVAIAFLVATVTTFVPAFLAAARHLSALGEDGYMPQSLANLAWVFTLVAIFLLAIGDQNFLVDITDFMVLISLGIITLSAVWLKTKTEKKYGKTLPLIIGFSCFAFGAAIYSISPSVVVFGSMTVIFAYLLFDILELGSLGAQLFLSVFGFVAVSVLGLFQHSIHSPGIFSTLASLFGIDANTVLLWGLVLTSVLLASNVLIDVAVLERTSVQ